MKSTKVVLAVTAVISIASAIISAPANALGTPKAQQTISWGWSDGADKQHRDFSEDDYDTPMDMPTLNVSIASGQNDSATVKPVVGRRVILESYDDLTQTWSTAVTSRTDASGVAVIHLDPTCTDSLTGAPMGWCDHDVSYRLKVLRSGTQKVLQSMPFTVSYAASIVGTFSN
jgi:hypothetical protein